MDYCSRLTATEIYIDEEMHDVSNQKLLKRLGFTKKQMYEVELVKSKNESKNA